MKQAELVKMREFKAELDQQIADNQVNGCGRTAPAPGLLVNRFAAADQLATAAGNRAGDELCFC